MSDINDGVGDGHTTAGSISGDAEVGGDVGHPGSFAEKAKDLLGEGKEKVGGLVEKVKDRIHSQREAHPPR